ncbi:MAG: VOC family protein [Dehalococcoidia bacterium]|nr:MAG: VOC family protein [Dehalococcoidia bacterium]
MGVISPTLAVRDVRKTIDFYQNSLGFKLGMVFPDINNPEYADLAKDGMVLMFLPAKNLSIAEKATRGIGVNLYMQIDGDIDQYYHELKKRGVNIVIDIKDEPYGIRDFTVADIDGYQLTFNQVSKTAKKCLSCSMPMTKAEDFGGGNPANLYCVHCSNQDGSLKSYDEVFEGMVNLMIKTQSMTRESAEEAVKGYMARMPAWSGD